MTGMDKVEPDLGLQQHADARPEMSHEALYSKRIIIGQVHANHVVAKELLAGGASGGRGMSEQYLVIGIPCAQTLDQRDRSAGFSDRHRVQPYDRLVAIHIVTPKAFADMIQILRLLARTPIQMKKGIGQ